MPHRFRASPPARVHEDFKKACEKESRRGRWSKQEVAMDWDQIEGNWKQLTDKVKE
jgi:hypothetical protein